jgi:hypothetical protein
MHRLDGIQARSTLLFFIEGEPLSTSDSTCLGKLIVPSPNSNGLAEAEHDARQRSACSRRRYAILS